jgi:hypothetical protein
MYYNYQKNIEYIKNYHTNKNHSENIFYFIDYNKLTKRILEKINN